MKDEERIRMLLSVLVDHKEDPMIKFLIENKDYLKEITNLTFEELQDLFKTKIDYINYYSVYDSLDLADTYLELLDPNYKKELDDLVDKGHVEFIESDRKRSFITTTVYETGRLEADITISQTHTVSDAYDLIHEYMHYTNTNEGINLDRRLFTEAVSILHEFLFYDYLKNNNYSSEDNISPIFERINSIIIYCNNLYNGITLYDEVKNHLEELSNVDQEKSKELYEEVIEKTKYAISSILAIKMYHDYKNGLIDINNINRFNESIQKNENLESLNHILIDKPNYNEMKEALDYFKNEILEEKIDIKK